jgi:DNA-binding GntR family transcriptional regulator
LIDFLGVRLVPPRNLYLRDQPARVQNAYIREVRLEHESIIDAIVRMDPARARNAARLHMQESLTRHTELSEQLNVRRDLRRKARLR